MTSPSVSPSRLSSFSGVRLALLFVVVLSLIFTFLNINAHLTPTLHQHKHSISMSSMSSSSSSSSSSSALIDDSRRTEGYYLIDRLLQTMNIDYSYNDNDDDDDDDEAKRAQILNADVTLVVTYFCDDDHDESTHALTHKHKQRQKQKQKQTQKQKQKRLGIQQQRLLQLEQKQKQEKQEKQPRDRCHRAGMLSLLSSLATTAATATTTSTTNATSTTAVLIYTQSKHIRWMRAHLRQSLYDAGAPSVHLKLAFRTFHSMREITPDIFITETHTKNDGDETEEREAGEGNDNDDENDDDDGADIIDDDDDVHGGGIGVLVNNVNNGLDDDFDDDTDVDADADDDDDDDDVSLARNLHLFHHSDTASDERIYGSAVNLMLIDACKRNPFRSSYVFYVRFVNDDAVSLSSSSSPLSLSLSLSSLNAIFRGDSSKHVGVTDDDASQGSQNEFYDLSQLSNYNEEVRRNEDRLLLFDLRSDSALASVRRRTSLSDVRNRLSITSPDVMPLLVYPDAAHSVIIPDVQDDSIGTRILMKSVHAKWKREGVNVVSANVYGGGVQAVKRWAMRYLRVERRRQMYVLPTMNVYKRKHGESEDGVDDDDHDQHHHARMMNALAMMYPTSVLILHGHHQQTGLCDRDASQDRLDIASRFVRLINLDPSISLNNANSGRRSPGRVRGISVSSSSCLSPVPQLFLLRFDELIIADHAHIPIFPTTQIDTTTTMTTTHESESVSKRRAGANRSQKAGQVNSLSENPNGAITYVNLGRLANQLYAMSAAYGLAKRLNKQFVPKVVDTGKEICTALVYVCPPTPNLIYETIHTPFVYTDLYSRLVKQPSRSFKLSGFLQSWKYFSGYETEIANTLFRPNDKNMKRAHHDLMTLIDKTHDHHEEGEEQQQEEEDSKSPDVHIVRIAVHIRLGDKAVWPIGNVSYGEALPVYILLALTHIADQFHSHMNTTAVCIDAVCEDVNYCKRLFTSPALSRLLSLYDGGGGVCSVVYVTHEDSDRILDIATLMLHDYIVGTIGTFSWYGAFLSMYKADDDDSNKHIYQALDQNKVHSIRKTTPKSRRLRNSASDNASSNHNDNNNNTSRLPLVRSSRSRVDVRSRRFSVTLSHSRVVLLNEWGNRFEDSMFPRAFTVVDPCMRLWTPLDRTMRRLGLVNQTECRLLNHEKGIYL